MKRIVLTLSLAALLAGCTPMSTRPDGVNAIGTTAKPSGASPDFAAERRLAEKLPLVTADGITPQNHQTKANELSDELNRDARRLDSARNVASIEK